jgi:hypothetical protein
VLPALTLPAWTTRLVIVLLLAGFPIALIFPRFPAGARIFSRLPSWAC